MKSRVNLAVRTASKRGRETARNRSTCTPRANGRHERSRSRTRTHLCHLSFFSFFLFPRDFILRAHLASFHRFRPVQLATCSRFYSAALAESCERASLRFALYARTVAREDLTMCRTKYSVVSPTDCRSLCSFLYLSQVNREILSFVS